MSIMKGKLRRSAVVVAFSLGAFQALSIVGATSAFAAVSCTFTSGTLAITANVDGDSVDVQQATSGAILLNGAQTDVACGGGTVALVSNTTAINISGGVGDQFVEIDLFDTAGDGVSWGTINWTVSLGTDNGPPNGDQLFVWQADTATGMNLAGGVNGIDLNNDGDLDLVQSGIEQFLFWSDATVKDVINFGGTTITGAAFPQNLQWFTTPGIEETGGGSNVITGGAGNDNIDANGGNDTIAPGAGDDTVNCGANTAVGDTLDYSGSPAAITMNLTVNPGTVNGWGLDTVSNCENGTGSAQADTLTGAAGAPNYFTPGAGNDTVNGGGLCDAPGASDTIDTSTSSDAETVDLAAGTATGGDGTDAISNIENVQSGSGADILTGDDCQNALMGGGGNDTLDPGADDAADDSLDGESGIDTVDYSTYAEAVTVDLVAGCSGDLSSECDDLNPTGTPSNENAILSTFDDVFNGSSFNNIVWPNGGQNQLNGCPAVGSCGIDSLNYSIGYTAGVTVNLAGGGQTAGGQDSINGFTNATGTAFNDTLIGTDLVGGTNGANLLVGAKGSDNISGNAGPDFVRAGAGNDRVRGGSGDDTLNGQGGKDNIRGSAGDDDIFGGKGKDFCTGGSGNDFIKTCEKPKHNGHGPNGPGLHQRI
jgi:hypothetical protein